MDRTQGIVDVLNDSEVSTPSFLYKYYAFDEYTHAIFARNEVYFSSPESFNDPFDSKIRVIYEGTRDAKKRFLRQWSQQHRPDLPRKEHLALQKTIMEQGLDQGMPEYVYKDLMATRASIGVFSMTEDRENIL
ncbi:MAG: hypothetical protein AMJ75_03280 [Phycisphaerae bacterium SM1_79]|nr:MAG: hypothetical protein AMJ75_03280 [Phycisphaerae bacterium SM1_79]